MTLLVVSGLVVGRKRLVRAVSRTNKLSPIALFRTNFFLGHITKMEFWMNCFHPDISLFVVKCWINEPTPHSYMVEMISKEFWLTSTSTPSMEYVRKSFYRYEINGILKHSTHLNFFKENRAHKVLDTFSDPKPPWLIRRGQHTWNGQKGDSEGFEAAGNLGF